MNEFKPVEECMNERLLSILINEFRVTKEMTVRIEQGSQFDTALVCFHGLESECKDFVVFQFKELKPGNTVTICDYRLYQCKFNNCDLIFNNLHKLYDHIRGHSGEKPF